MNSEQINNQDWDTVYIRPKFSKKEQIQRGQTETVKKYSTGNSNPSSSNLNARKLDEETDANSHKKDSMDFRQQVQQVRLALGLTQLGLTQQQLAQKLNVKQEVIRDIENGTAIKNSALNSRLKRILKIGKTK